MAEQNNLNIEFLEEQFSKQPDSLLFARLADAYLKTQRLDKAVKICEDGLKKHPYYVTGHFVLGKCYFAQKEFEEAEKEFKRVLLFDPKFLSAHKYYGDVMKEIGWENTCAMSYKKIVQIDPLDEIARKLAGEYIIESEERESPSEGTGAPLEVDAAVVAPIPVSPEEEDLLFEETAQVHDEVESPKDEQIDEQKAEEFSYLLDDIFKDEVVKEEEKPAPLPDLDETIITIDKSPESVLADLELLEQQPKEPVAEVIDKQSPAVEEPSFQIEVDDDATKPFDLSPPEPEPQAEEKPPPDFVESATPQKSKKGKIVTPTLGEIYAAQGQYAKAVDVFDTLLKKHPDNEFYSKKISELQQKLAESKDAPES